MTCMWLGARPHLVPGSIAWKSGANTVCANAFHANWPAALCSCQTPISTTTRRRSADAYPAWVYLIYTEADSDCTRLGGWHVSVFIRALGVTHTLSINY